MKAFCQGSCVLGVSLLAPLLLAQGDPVPKLIEKMQDSDSFRVRTQAAAVLGRLRDQRALDPLIKQLRDDDSYAVRGASAGALGNFGGPRVVSPLFRALDDPDAFVVSVSEKALQSLKGDEVAAAFRPHLVEGSGREREIAFVQLSGMARQGSVAATSTLFDVLANDELKARALTVLQDLQGATLVNAVLPKLEADDSEARIAAALLLVRHPSERVASALSIAYRSGEEETVREQLRQALFTMRNHVDVEGQIELAKHGEEREIRSQAIRLLGVVGQGRAIMALEELLADEDTFIQSSAALALADAGATQALPKVESLRAKTDNERLQGILDVVVKRLKK